jgi:hypothetical protein
MMNVRRGGYVLRAAALVLVLWALAIAVLAIIMYLLNGHWGSRFNVGDHKTADTTSRVLSFSEVLYFAIVTTTTVGYGDYTPIGWLRLLACVDGVVGILMAGFLVARVTTELIDPLAIVRNAAGYWFDHLEIARNDGTTLEFVSVLKIERLGGQWNCGGTNYNLDGSLRHTFDGRITGAEGNTLLIPYFNDPAAEDDYTRGIWVVKLGDIDRPRWYTSYTHDVKHGMRDKSFGIRLERRRDAKMFRGLCRADPGSSELCAALTLALKKTRTMKGMAQVEAAT